MEENEVLGCAKETRSSKAVPKEQCLSQGTDGKVGERELLESLCRNPEGDRTLKQKGKHKAIDNKAADNMAARERGQMYFRG